MAHASSWFVAMLVVVVGQQVVLLGCAVEAFQSAVTQVVSVPKRGPFPQGGLRRGHHDRRVGRTTPTVVCLSSDGADSSGDDDESETQKKKKRPKIDYGSGPVSDADEAALLEQIGEIYGEMKRTGKNALNEWTDVATGLPVAVPDPDSPEAEFARIKANMPASEQWASLERQVENIYEVKEKEALEWAEEFKKEQEKQFAEARANFDAFQAETRRVVSDQLDEQFLEAAKVAGLDTNKLRREFKAIRGDETETEAYERELAEIMGDDVLDATELGDELSAAAAARKKTDGDAKQTSPWPPARDARVAVVAPNGGKAGLDASLVADAARALGYENVEVAADSNELAERSVASFIFLADDAFGGSTVDAAVSAVSTGAVGRNGNVVLVSRQLATKTGNFDVALRNMNGGLTRALETEDAVKFACSKRVGDAVSHVILRLGDVKKNAKSAPSGNEIDVRVGDDLDAPSTPRVAAMAIARAALLEPAARNITFSVAGAADDATDATWRDEFLRLDGPELARLAPGARKGRDATLALLREWLREWATVFLAPGSGLTTPVELDKTDDGVILTFVDRNKRSSSSSSSDAPRRRRRTQQGGIRLLAETNPTAPGTLRVRAVREPYDPGLAVKAMSEETILERLKRDFAAQFS